MIVIIFFLSTKHDNMSAKGFKCASISLRYNLDNDLGAGRGGCTLGSDVTLNS